MNNEKPELHPVVELFLRRCASNPEEVAEGTWNWVLSSIQQHGSEAERAAVLPISNKIMLDELHRNFMRELLNPEPEQGNLFRAEANQSLTQKQTQQLEQQKQLQIQQEYENQLHQNLWKKLGKL